MPATLAWAHGWEKIPVSLHFEIPAGSDWTVATQLAAGDRRNVVRAQPGPPDGQPRRAQPSRSARSGRSATRSSASRCITTAPTKKPRRTREMCQAVVTEEEGVFGAFPKYDTGNYTFLLDYLPYVCGDGMEHRDSTVITGAARPEGRSAAQMIGTVVSRVLPLLERQAHPPEDTGALRFRTRQHVGRTLVRRRLHQLLRPSHARTRWPGQPRPIRASPWAAR